MRPLQWKIDIQFFLIVLIFLFSFLFPPEIHLISRITTASLIVLLGYRCTADPAVSFGSGITAVFPLICVFLIINSILSFSPYSSISALGNYLLFAILFVAFARRFSTRQIKPLLIFIAAIASIISAYGIYQHFFGFKTLARFLGESGSLFPEIFLRKVESGRIFSTFVLPAALAGFLLMTIPLTLFLVLSSASRRGRVFYLFLLMVQAAGLFLSFSLGALIALFLSLFAVAWFRFKRRLSIIAAISFVFIMTAFVFFSYRKIHISGFFSADSPLILRWGNWKAALLMIRDHPLFGVGNGSFGTAFSQYRESWMNESHFAHNSFLQIAAENGIFILPLLALFVFFLLRSAMKAGGGHGPLFRDPGAAAAPSDAQDGIRQSLRPFVSFACLTFLFHNLFDFTFYLPSIAFLFFSLCGLVFVSPAGQGGGRGEKRFFDTSRLLFLTLLTLSLLFFISFFLGDASFERARQMREQGDLRRADLMLARAEGFNPLKSEYCIYRAQLLTDDANDAKDPEAAIAEAQRAISLDPFIPFYYRVLSDIFLLQREPIKAYGAIAKAAELYPADESYRKRKELLWKLLANVE